MPNGLSSAFYENVILFLFSTILIGVIRLFLDVRDIKIVLVGIDGKNGMRALLSRTSELSVKTAGKVAVLEALYAKREKELDNESSAQDLDNN